MFRNSMLLLLISLLFYSCQHETTETNSFSSSNDTLQIRTLKIKGKGVFPIGAASLATKDTSEVFFGDIIYPTGIDSMKRIERSVDFVTSRYYSYKRGRNNLLKYVNEDIEYNYIDTTIDHPESENYLNIVEGYMNGKRIIIVDENYNKDLSDDSIRKVEEIEWTDPNDFVEFTYPIYNGKEIVYEKSWVGFRTYDGNDMIHWGKFEHIIAEFSLDEKVYKIAISRPAYDFVYDYESDAPFVLQFKLLNDQEDTYEYFETDFLQLGQYVKLDNQYYCLENISRDGRELTLVKENDFPSKIGIQVGMKAPEFTCIAENGDTVHSSDLYDKGIIIVNMCGCGGDYESTQAYNDILSEFGEEYHVLGVDSQFFNEPGGILINSENPFNEEFFMNYRQMYCSRATYVIDEGFRVETKFASTDWQAFLVNDKTASNTR